MLGNLGEVRLTNEMCYPLFPPFSSPAPTPTPYDCVFSFCTQKSRDNQPSVPSVCESSHSILLAHLSRERIRICQFQEAERTWLHDFTKTKLVEETSEKLLELITPIPKKSHTTNTHYQNFFSPQKQCRTF